MHQPRQLPLGKQLAHLLLKPADAQDAGVEIEDFVGRD
jgi:hypothetical protein